MAPPIVPPIRVYNNAFHGPKIIPAEIAKGEPGIGTIIIANVNKRM